MARLLLLLLLPLNVYAQDFQWNDNWHGRDKAQHAIAGMVIGSAVTAYSKDPIIGTSVGCGIGIVKEITDLRPNHSPTFQDAVVTCLGSGIGAYVYHGLVLTPNRIMFTRRF